MTTLEWQNLRALSVGEILDVALRMYRVKFFRFLGIAAIALIPEGIIEALLFSVFPGSDISRLQNSLTNFFTGIATMALIVAVSSVYLGGDFTIRSAYSKGLKRFWSIVGANFLMGMVIALPVIFLMFCLLAMASMPSSELLLVGVILLIVPIAVFLFTRWSLSSEAIILEDIGASAGISRTWNLTRDYFWRVLGTSFAAGLFSTLLTVLPFLFVDYVLGFTGLDFRIVQLIDLVVQQLALVLVLPFTVTVKVLIYYDLRIRKEGFDLMLRANGIQE